MDYKKYNENSSFQNSIINGINRIITDALDKIRPTITDGLLSILDIGCATGMNTYQIFNNTLDIYSKYCKIEAVNFYLADLPCNHWDVTICNFNSNIILPTTVLLENKMVFCILNTFNNRLVQKNSLNWINCFNTLNWILEFNEKSKDSFTIRLSKDIQYIGRAHKFFEKQLDLNIEHRSEELKSGGFYCFNFLVGTYNDIEDCFFEIFKNLATRYDLLDYLDDFTFSVFVPDPNILGNFIHETSSKFGFNIIENRFDTVNIGSSQMNSSHLAPIIDGVFENIKGKYEKEKNKKHEKFNEFIMEFYSQLKNLNPESLNLFKEIGNQFVILQKK